jgi:ribosomal protein L37AE/L43A
MGFFDKKAVCEICGKEIGMNRYRIKKSDSWICPECFKSAGGTAQINLSKMTSEEIREQIRQKQESQKLHDHTVKNSPLQTGEGMYEYCEKNGYGSGFTKGWGVKHFEIIEENLTNNEIVLMAFIGLHNYKSASKHDGNFAYAITNKRILMAQKDVIGQKFQTVSMENINDITFQTGLLFGVLTIDTYKETFNVGLDKQSAQKINAKIHEVLEERKQKPSQENKSIPVISSADELKKFAELHAQGILTDEEFAAKKKQLLGI